MDRNLGATVTGAESHGLYYQWGRKDPFRKPSGSPLNVDTLTTSADNLAKSIAHPDTFYVSLSSPYDWIGPNQNNNLWSTVDDEKAQYDPCPFGWRVAVVKNDADGSPWNGFTSNTYNGASYPLAGYLDGFSGHLVGNTGGVWGASARARDGFVFKFTSAPGSGTATSALRTNAYPVRCVKDIR
jgi:hypothetical protein